MLLHETIEKNMLDDISLLHERIAKAKQNLGNMESEMIEATNSISNKKRHTSEREERNLVVKLKMTKLNCLVLKTIYQG